MGWLILILILAVFAALVCWRLGLLTSAEQAVETEYRDMTGAKPADPAPAVAAAPVADAPAADTTVADVPAAEKGA